MRYEAHQRNRKSGQAAVEVALMLPWFVLLFAGLVDFGFFAYSFISVENAAREAVLYTSSDPLFVTNSNAACQHALGEVRYLLSVATSCGTGSSAGNMTATATQDTSATGCSSGDPCAKVAIQYTTAQLFPLPLIAGRFTITRTAVMRVYQ